MKKKSNRTKRIIERIIQNKNIINEAERLRIEAGVPAGGFPANIAPKETSELIVARQRFIEFAARELLRSGVDANYWGLNKALCEFFDFGGISKSTEKKMPEWYGCSLINLDADSNEVLPDGVYIRLGADTTIADLQSFIERNKRIIRAYQKGYRFRQGMPTRKKLMPLTSSLYGKIKKYMHFSVDELKELSNSQSPYKDMQISAILNKERPNTTTPETVKTYIQRIKRREKGDI